MSLKRLVSKYISSAQQAFEVMKFVQTPMTIDPKLVGRVVDYARDYLSDAAYYREKEKFEVSLTSVAYCEGLMDALRLLGAVEFEWPETRKDAEAE
jgi:FAD synthetase